MGLHSMLVRMNIAPSGQLRTFSLSGNRRLSPAWPRTRHGGMGCKEGNDANGSSPDTVGCNPPVWEGLPAAAPAIGCCAVALFLHAILDNVVFNLFVCILNMREYVGERPVIEPLHELMFSNKVQFLFEMERVLYQLLVLILVRLNLRVSILIHKLLFEFKVEIGI